MGNKDEAMYKRGIKNLEKAKQLAEKEGRNMVSSVLKFKLAWAEFRKYPEKKPGEHYDKICTYFHEVLEDQKTPAKWNPIIKDNLK